MIRLLAVGAPNCPQRIFDGLLACTDNSVFKVAVLVEDSGDVVFSGGDGVRGGEGTVPGVFIRPLRC